ncbi:MAG: serine/threonine protein kinase [Planctomycetaceae bacterium]
MTTTSPHVQRANGRTGHHEFEREELVAPTSWGLPEYEMVSLISRGAIADVWHVRDNTTGADFALKQLREEWEDDPTAHQLLKNEVHVSALVKSPYVVRVWDAPTGFEQTAVLMEWLGNTTLARHLHDAGSLSIRESLWIARQCALGIQDLVAAGYVHGDLKPENIALLPGGAIKLIDLGFAQPVAVASTIPRADVFTGTISHTAPEVSSLEPSTPVCRELYSLGILLFHMLTGRLPFQGTTAADVMRQHRERRPPLLRIWCPAASDDVVHFVNRLLAKHPLRRASNLTEVIRELIRLELAHWPVA